MSRHSRMMNAGFTLIELMIVVVIIAILAAIAYPSYAQYVVRSNRQAARAAIYDIADRQEQFFLDNKRYGGSLSEIGYAGDTMSIGRDGQWTGGGDADRTYDLTITDPTNMSYTIEAAPQGVQAARDGVCGTLSLTSDGERGPGPDCW